MRSGGFTNPGGFTLVELVTVLVLVGVLAAVALPKMSLLSGFTDSGYRDKIISTLAYARAAAVAQRRNVCVTVNGNGLLLTRDISDPSLGGVLSCPNTGSNRLPLPAPDTRYCGSATTGNEICAPSSVTLAGSNFSFSPLGKPSGVISFNPLGKPSGVSSVTFTIAGTATYTVTVEAETGYVH